MKDHWYKTSFYMHRPFIPSSMFHNGCSSSAVSDPSVPRPLPSLHPELPLGVEVEGTQDAADNRQFFRDAARQR